MGLASCINQLMTPCPFCTGTEVEALRHRARYVYHMSVLHLLCRCMWSLCSHVVHVMQAPRYSGEARVRL